MSERKTSTYRRLLTHLLIWRRRTDGTNEAQWVCGARGDREDRRDMHTTQADCVTCPHCERRIAPQSRESK